MDVPTDTATGRVPGLRAAELYDSHVHEVHAYLARRVGRDLANDLCGEVFRIAIESHDRFDPRLGSDRAWLYGIASNLLRRHWRSEVRRLRAFSRQASASIGVLDDDPLLRAVERVDAADALARLLPAVADLAVEDRDLLVLIAWQQCSHSEVATALGIPEGTVRSRLHRIRTSLRVAMTHPTPTGDDHG